MNDQHFWKTHVKQGAVLNPIDRISEVLFGLIMVLTFTGAISVASDGKQEIRELLWAALGCNLAWGIIDAIMYLMNLTLGRGRGIVVFKRMVTSQNQEESRTILKEEFDPLLISLMTDYELNQMSDRLKNLPEPSKKFLLTGIDLLRGLEIFLLVFLCTFPVAIPLLLLDEISPAMKASNGVALLLLFIGGYLLARYAGFRKILTALVYVAIGVSLVALTMLLGG